MSDKKEYQNIEPIRCPFCGSNNKIGMARDTHETQHFAVCTNCGANGPIKRTPKEAAEAWNTRYEIMEKLTLNKVMIGLN